MSVSEIISILGISIIPYAISRYFSHSYVLEAEKRDAHDEQFDPRRLKKYDALRIIFAFLGLFPTLILTPLENRMFKNLYKRYVYDVRTTRDICQRANLSFTEKQKSLEEAGIYVSGSAEPINYPDTWYMF